jgi:hypothetical protein
MNIPAFVTTLLLAAAPAAAQHSDQHADMTRRGDAVMGFSHEETTHHFRLRLDGGDIEITADDPHDEESASQIRGHLRHVTQMFGAGDFTAPFLIHSQDPPGTKVMAARKAEIAYAVEPLPAGARVRIVAKTPEARAAVHEFLRFQITDHRTGDPLTIQQP